MNIQREQARECMRVAIRDALQGRRVLLIVRRYEEALTDLKENGGGALHTRIGGGLRARQPEGDGLIEFVTPTDVSRRVPGMDFHTCYGFANLLREEQLGLVRSRVSL